MKNMKPSSLLSLLGDVGVCTCHTSPTSFRLVQTCGPGNKNRTASTPCVMLVWPYVFTKSVSSKLQTVGSTSPSTEQERPQVERVKVQSCDSTFDTYCLNNGQCMLLVDLNEYHCKCDVGYSGPRCAHLELSCQPGKEEPLILTIVCVALLIIGLVGLLYFFYKWYKRNRCPRHQK